MPEERREQVTRVGIEQGQRVTGGTRRFRWKAAAFHGWHEPDKSRGLRPESVSGSGCKSPGRLGLCQEDEKSSCCTKDGGRPSGAVL